MSSVAPSSKRTAWLVALGVTLVSGASNVVASRPALGAARTMLLVLGTPAVLLAVATVAGLARRGELAARLSPRRGDIALGFLVAAVLYGAATAARGALLARGSFGEPWLMRVYLQLGPPAVTATFAVGGAAMGLGALGEIVWRGAVMGRLADVYGPWRACAITAVLDAIACSPTAYGLADSHAGPNPLVVLAAALSSLVWGTMVTLAAGRLAPAVFSHALVSWAVTQFPLWRP